MQAALLHRYGEPLTLAEVPAPIVGPRDVLIRVHAASVNPIDVKIRAGTQRGAMRYKLPWITGMDVSGEVIGVGAEVTRFSMGDEVFSSPGHRRPGCYAEQVAIPEDEVALKPTNLTHTEAATIPLVGLTAWQSLMPRLAEKRGQKVFIQAGSGGVGTFAIQLARHFGAEVTTTCSAANGQLVSGLGADTVIDYHSQRFEEVLSDVDIVLDSLGGEQRDRAFAVLKKDGRLATIVSGLPGYSKRFGPNLGVVASGLSVVRFKLKGLVAGVQTAVVIRRADGEQLAQIAALIEQGAIRPVIDRVYPLAEIAAAHAHVETGRTRGKVAIQVV
ncbi:MAG: NADPH:quinone reductase-like Zn-dependent oxidoreductase [Myxococcota bacterium]|jgi:NADPH:quinone reductase-like Zn-dependent oxidoreductase